MTAPLQPPTSLAGQKRALESMQEADIEGFGQPVPPLILSMPAKNCGMASRSPKVARSALDPFAGTRAFTVDSGNVRPRLGRHDRQQTGNHRIPRSPDR